MSGGGGDSEGWASYAKGSRDGALILEKRVSMGARRVVVWVMAVVVAAMVGEEAYSAEGIIRDDSGVI